ncbi:MAG: flippase-like domain-containing protein [Candidatus Omnitrophica bacterium]|nr:flippase-like domain-containing protein [Candidatus Omnitrophota bacterium]
MAKKILLNLLRVLVTVIAFWWIFREVHVDTFLQTIKGADWRWLVLAAGLFAVSQGGCILRWKLLAPPHPRLTIPFLADSFLVGAFFSAFLPTQVGGDVMRSYDLIKVTGQWKEPIASVLMDRLIGMLGLLIMAAAAWLAFPPAREDRVINSGFFGFCLLVVVAYGVLASRRALKGILSPFGKIGLGQLQSHATQFQETLLSYLHRPRIVAVCVLISVAIQILGILMTVAVTKALGFTIPVLFLFLIVPIVIMVAQIPVSLNGWGLREGTTVLLLQRIGINPAMGLSLALVGAVIQLLSGFIGGFLFLGRQFRRKR